MWPKCKALHFIICVFLPLGDSLKPTCRPPRPCFPALFQLHSNMDKDDGNVKYVLTGEGAGNLFIIDEKSGDIHATKRLDREEKAYYILRAKAVDRFTNEALEGESEFVIKIHDINDNEPRFTKDLYLARVPEMSDIGEQRAGGDEDRRAPRAGPQLAPCVRTVRPSVRTVRPSVRTFKPTIQTSRS